MTPERWARIKELFDAALDREPAARAAYLDEACPADGEGGELRREVDSLLAAHDEAGEFLEVPVLADSAAAAAAGAAALAGGTRLGPYEIAETIGTGGMGEVYRARDSRLDRDVAIKVLPAAVAADAARVRRFEQEARAASALNHPNIVAVYDTGWHEGIPYIVTELLEGETLADRLARGPLALRRALECAQQIASGLVAAHERGIIHRDLKPANLFLTSQGAIKILDFGVAKLAPTAADGGDAATTPGLMIGTVGYMSPEQVRAAPVDIRSDQFSLGCVLYELLTGRPPFQRGSAAETMAAVLEAEPAPLGETNVRVPRAIAWVVERCLAKDPADRYASTRDLARDLELALGRLSELTLGAGPLPYAGPRARWWRGLFAAAILAAAVGITWWWARRDRPAAGPPPSEDVAAAPAVATVRYLTHTGRDASPAASPDGNTIAFSARRDGRRRIWLKQVGTGSEAPLTGGDDDFPRFAPDGSSILFARSEGEGVSLYRIALVGGDERKVVEDALYGDFSPDGRRIAFVRQAAEGAGITSTVATAAPDGSDVRELARLDARAYPAGAFVCPRWSPDGRWLAATQSTLQLGEPTIVALIDAETGRVRQLEPPSAAGVWRGGLAWTGSDEVVFAEPESVVGQQTGTSSRVLLWDLATGRTRPLLSSPINIVALDVLASGRLVLQTRAVHQNLREIPLAAGKGDAAGRWLTRGNAADRQPIVSPDADRVAFSSNRSGNLDLWALSRASGAVTRLTDHPAQDSDPAFMPDGRLLWSSNRSGAFEIWLAEADGSGARQVTRDGVDAENPVASPDGAWIFYASANPETRGIMKIRPDGSGAAQVVAGNAILPEVSPDGAHVAFASDEGTQRASLRVARIADGAPVFEIVLPAWNTGAGIDQGRSRWLPDGRGLVYVARDGANYGIYLAAFAPGARAGQPRRVAWLAPDLDAESMGVTPDGASLVVSFREQLQDLMLADGVAGLKRPARR